MRRSKQETSKSQKMRSILYLLWSKDHENYDNAQGYYEAKMDAMINVLLKRLDEPISYE